MKIFLILAVFAGRLAAQAPMIGGNGGGGGNGATNITALPATCSPLSSPNLVFLTTAYSTYSAGLYECTATNTWTAQPANDLGPIAIPNVQRIPPVTF